MGREEELERVGLRLHRETASWIAEGVGWGVAAGPRDYEDSGLDPLEGGRALA